MKLNEGQWTKDSYQLPIPRLLHNRKWSTSYGKKKTNKNIYMSLLFFILLSFQGEEYKRSW